MALIYSVLSSVTTSTSTSPFSKSQCGIHNVAGVRGIDSDLLGLKRHPWSSSNLVHDQVSRVSVESSNGFRFNQDSDSIPLEVLQQLYDHLGVANKGPTSSDSCGLTQKILLGKTAENRSSHQLCLYLRPLFWPIISKHRPQLYVRAQHGKIEP